MQKFLVFAALTLAGTAASAVEPQQVNQDEYVQKGGNVFEKRTDGLVFHKDTTIPVLMGNGSARDALGPAYRDDFEYGDGLGLMCSARGRTGKFSVVQATGATCDASCANAACVVGFETSMDAAADILACSDNTADACVCQTTSVDEVLLGCGANWEAPALGVSLVELASGVKLAAVALLAQDIGPDMDAEGLDVAGDLTDNDGMELLGGMYGASGRPLYPGIDPAFKFCVTFRIEEAGAATDLGTDDFWIGFRDVTPPNATFNSYNSYAVVGFDSVADGWHTETEDDGGGTTTTDIGFDYTDGGTSAAMTTACVHVSDAGAVTYTVDGATSSSAVGYTFDSGEPVIPFLHFLHASNVMDEVHISKWEVSFPSE